MADIVGRGGPDGVAGATVKKSSLGRSRAERTTQIRLDLSILDFGLFGLINLLAAFYAPIQDCDETFNYWEPTHYLNHGYGLQTWEYSPEYALRSWLYIAIHAFPGDLFSLFSGRGVFQFYAIRVLLGTACAFAQTRLLHTISQELGPRVGWIYQIAMLSSTGIFYASVAYLPSGFAMLTTMMGVSEFLNRQKGHGTANGITWFGVGAIVGWPFSGALILPLFLDEIVLIHSSGISDSAVRVLNGAVRVGIVAALDFVVNVFFYRKLVFIPWRIISYNIFSGSSRGPDIFGTEPWHFYLRNLLLNFHIWFLLALFAGPIIVLRFLSHGQSTTKMSLLRTLTFVTPFYFWLAIFTLQPHKEERFMYPVYPFLCINAAITAHSALLYLGRSDPQTLVGKIPAKLKLFIVIGLASFASTVGLLRTAGTVTAYHAPLEIYKPLQRPEYADQPATVCLGKEWYRFPTSYFLPGNMRATFIKSSFDGLLPGPFNESSVEFGLLPTWVVPPGMNDRNAEDPGKHVAIEQCSFLVDSEFSADSLKEDPQQPRFISDPKLEEIWEKIACTEFLDSSSTHPMARIFWVPTSRLIPQRYLRQWGRYCLMRRRYF